MEILPSLVQSRSLGVGAGQFFYERHIALGHFHEDGSQLHRHRHYLTNLRPERTALASRIVPYRWIAPQLPAARQDLHSRSNSVVILVGKPRTRPAW